jgi:hypothetical protein
VKQTICAILLCVSLAACGGGGGSSTTTGGTTTGSGVNPPATTPPAPPTLVTAGSTGVDITVPGPSTSPVLNAQVLGAQGGIQGTKQFAFSTGDFVHQGAQGVTVLLFGPGLSANNVSHVNAIGIGGSGDVTVVPNSVNGLTASDGTTTGISFAINVAPNAVLGPRTVFLVAGNDMTTFTGGLEVVQ